MDVDGASQAADGSMTASKRGPSPGPVQAIGEAGSSSEAKRLRLDGDAAMKHPEDARLASIRGDVESEPSSPSNSRQSSPASTSRQSPIIVSTPTAVAGGGGFGGAKRRGADEGRKALPRNVDRVYYGEYDIKTWYHSPYPLDDDHHGASAAAAVSGANGGGAGPSIHRTPSSSKIKLKIRNSSSGGGQQAQSASAKPANGGAGGGGVGTTAASEAIATAPTAVTHPDAAAMPPPAATSKAPPATTGLSSTPSAPSSMPSPARIGSSSSNSTPTGPLEPKPRVSHLWICEGCFKYMRTHAAWYAHKVQHCKHRHPPGRKVYQRGSHIIWEVDGAQQKLYAQNLSLFGKLFIDHKTIFFDVEPFVFYIVTDAAASFDYVLGFFSKEKVSYDDYNLACIITFPPYQKKGFGTLMIEYSYHLSAKAGIAGGPERPLSELGFKGYLSYWSAVVLRTLALALDDDDADIAPRLLPIAPPSNTSPSKAGAQAVAAASEGQGSSKEQQKAAARVRASLLFGTSPIAPSSPAKKAVIKDSVDEAAGPASTPARPENPDLESLATTLHERGELTAEELAEVRNVSKKGNVAGPGKGDLPAGLVAKLEAAQAQGQAADKPVSTAAGEGSSSNQDGEHPTASSTSTPTTSRIKLDRAARHLTPVRPSDKPSTTTTPSLPAATPSAAAAVTSQIPSNLACIATTLERLSIAANLRVEDTAFALAECGLLKMRMRGLPSEAEGSSSGPMMVADVAAQTAAAAGGGASEVGKETPAATPSPLSSQMVILVTRDAVRRAMRERGIKRPVLETQYVFA